MPSAEPRGHPKQGAVTPRRRAVGKTRLSPSQGPYRRPTSLLPMPVRRSGPGLTSQPAPASDGCRPSDTQPHVACMGVETIASRAVTSLYLLIRRYSKRHGLHRPREVGRRAAGRCASGGRGRGLNYKISISPDDTVCATCTWRWRCDAGDRDSDVRSAGAFRRELTSPPNPSSEVRWRLARCRSQLAVLLLTPYSLLGLPKKTEASHCFLHHGAGAVA